MPTAGFSLWSGSERGQKELFVWDEKHPRVPREHPDHGLSFGVLGQEPTEISRMRWPHHRPAATSQRREEVEDVCKRVLDRSSWIHVRNPSLWRSRILGGVSFTASFSGQSLSTHWVYGPEERLNKKKRVSGDPERPLRMTY